MATRAKMKCSFVRTSDYGAGLTQYKIVRFDAQYDQSIPEDQRFQKATPTGHIEMQIDNPAALEQLIPGKYYYVDFSPVEIQP